MGFQDRHYARDDWSPRQSGPGRSGSQFADWEVWKKLIAINVVVFLLQIFVTRPATMDDLRQSPYPGMWADYGEEFDSGPEQGTDAANDDLSGDETTKPENADERKMSKYIKKQGNGTLTGTREWKRQRDMEELLQLMPRVSILQTFCELDSKKVLRGQLWRLITAGFCHDRMSVWHLLFNMLFLYWFGSRLERVFGSAEFTAFYFASLLVSSLAYVALDLYTRTSVPAIGASGAIWGVVAIYALMYPYERIYIYLLFPIEIRWLVLLYFIFDLHPVLLALGGDPQFSGVGHAAHIGGAIFGFLYWRQGWRLLPMINRFKSDPSGRKAKPGNSNDSSNVPKMPRKDFESRLTDRDSDRMDEILDKVSREGRDSLTKKELEFLEETSRRIRGDGE